MCPLEVLATKQLAKDVGSPGGPGLGDGSLPGRSPTAAMSASTNPKPSAKEGPAGARQPSGAAPQHDPDFTAALPALWGQGGVAAATGATDSSPRRGRAGHPGSLGGSAHGAGAQHVSPPP